MKIAFSPCPNDTYLFHAWVTGRIGVPPKEVHFADIDALNTLAHTGSYPLIKLSFPCFAAVSATYQLLPIGAALGFHCGPKIISKTPFSLDALPSKRIAIPGKETTAHHLLNKLAPAPQEKHFCLYHEVMDLIERDVVECGVIIHETRFTFAQKGFSEVIDLGEEWHRRFELPLPLGGLAVRRDYPYKEQLLKKLRASLAFAQSTPDASRSFILQHSQEKDPQVVEKHIATYVNAETEDLSPLGIKAIETLTGLCLKDCLYLPSAQKPQRPSRR
ncbi:MAG: 1,4-dihydroxy-6-naphtoate synthase [Chlamydiales bacterium]|nr:1,4-dihydroxy-6-naphtoate synthase [Chlamydiales bacterium]